MLSGFVRGARRGVDFVVFRFLFGFVIWFGFVFFGFFIRGFIVEGGGFGVVGLVGRWAVGAVFGEVVI